MKLSFIVTSSVLAFMANAASAATVQLTDISATWLNTVGGAAVNTINNGSLTPSLRWGTGNSGQSGYDLVIDSGASAMPGETFTLGSFTHINRPINAGTSISSTELDIVGDIWLDGVLEMADAKFSFSFLHNETSNTGGGNCCDDIVMTSLLNDTSVFSVGGVDYTLSIAGFFQNGVFNSVFISPEGGSTQGQVMASFSSEVPPVPLPAAGWLLLGGLGAMGVASKRRKAA
ncbi:THxN family PEP-CTERM protein [Tropicimonas sp.]|uniref:THxN family PEP-CTERM protein n=1 Tax=Tropicimonas sp. TaxID=2067044 RepID=UPI003A84B1DF